MRLVVRGDEFGRSYEIPEGACVVGRSPDCDISIPAPSISKHHLQVTRQGDVISIRDLASTNGTYVNGLKVSAVDLRPNDVVRLGKQELVFDAAAGQPAGGPVFFDEPPAPASPPPGAGQAVEEPIMPDGQPFAAGHDASDDTPVDGEFVPVRYEAERQHGPELVARGEKWFIRDPATNREVEIVPKGGEFARPDMGTYYAERRKKKITQLVAAAVGLLSLIVVIFILIPSGPKKSTGPQHKFSEQKYDALVDQGIDALEAGDYGKALTAFNTAHEEYPRRQIAGTFKEIALLWQKAGKDMTDLEWKSAQDRLDDVLDSNLHTSKAKGFATRWLDWIAGETAQQRILKKGQDQYAANNIEDAFKTLSVLRDGPIRKKHADFIEQVRAACERTTLARAEQLKANRDWDEAGKAFEAAKTYVKDAALIDQQVELCRAGRDQKGSYDAAQNFFEQKRYGDAKVRLESIPPDSPYAADAKALLTSVVQAEKLQRAGDMFDAGQGAEAIAFIDAEQVAGSAALKETIRQALELNEAAEKAYKQNEPSDAIENWERLIKLLEDREKNNFRLQAKAQVDRLMADPTFLASVSAGKARRALSGGQPEEARKHANAANKFAPDKKYGDAVLHELSRQGKIFFNDGLAAFFKKDYKQAEEKFDMVLRYTTPEDKSYEGAVRYLNQIKQGENNPPTLDNPPPKPPDDTKPPEPKNP
jgi:hypothetical protein